MRGPARELRDVCLPFLVDEHGEMKSDALAQAAKAMEEAQKEKDVSALIKVRPCFACRPVCGRTHRSLAPRRSSTRSTGRPGTVLLVATLGHMSHTKASISYFSTLARAQFACTKQDKTNTFPCIQPQRAGPYSLGGNDQLLAEWPLPADDAACCPRAVAAATAQRPAYCHQPSCALHCA